MTFQELLEEDREEGRVEGREEGREEGRAEDEIMKAAEIAKAMKAEGLGVEVIQKTTGLSLDEIEKL